MTTPTPPPATRFRPLHWLGLMVAIAAGAVMPAAAQLGSPAYRLLEAIRERDGNKVAQLLEATPTLINTRDLTTRESALHIVTARRDPTWMRFLLQRGADANAEDRARVTPLLIAAQIGFVEGARVLLQSGAQVNRANGRGETALHIAVQRRDLAMVQALMAAGADPELQDGVAGMSPRDYATRDNRAATVLQALDRRVTSAPVRPGSRPAAGPN